jgi:hypothetical protein
MHGVHSFLGSERLWWSALQTAERSLTDAVTADARAHSLFHTLDPAHRFRAGGLIGQDGTVDREALHRLMALLAQRIGEASAAPEAKLENTGLPSGYTYLMQFIAHDLVDSVVSIRREAGALRPSGLNARAAALMLDTLYGVGPEEASNVYAVTEGTLRGKGDIPGCSCGSASRKLQAPARQPFTVPTATLRGPKRRPPTSWPDRARTC